MKPVTATTAPRTIKFRLLASALLAFATVANAKQPLPAYDLLLQGGHVLDARNHIDAVRDVATKMAASPKSPSTSHLRTR